MSLDWYDDVLDFHERFAAFSQDAPGIPPRSVRELREKLVSEEYRELMRGMDEGNLTEVADACADLVYVVIGTAIAYGIDLRPIWDAVQRANMQKVPYSEELAAECAKTGVKIPVGKVMKPPGWRPPDIAGLLADQAK